MTYEQTPVNQGLTLEIIIMALIAGLVFGWAIISHPAMQVQAQPISQPSLEARIDTPQDIQPAVGYNFYQQTANPQR